ncbi:Multidrug resistance protein 2 [Verticillium dahliae VDG1]|nr:Multidrug resistance protein 2 [Verticillium dahliae VDG1]
MTSASTDLYPQYCFHLSPTFDQWCLLTAATIHALDTHNEYEGQGLFFHRNLPVKWVRLVGVVVAIDDVYNRRIFTIDDSSGACIECNVAVKVIPAVLPTFGDKDPLAYAPRRLEFLQPGCDDVDVGAVVDIKGSVALFRDEKTVKIQKVKTVRSTAQEIALWEKRDNFMRDVLGVPWVVDEKQMRRCRREAEGRERKEKREEKERQRREAENGELVTGLERASGARLTSKHVADDEAPEAQNRPVTGLEKGSGRKVAALPRNTNTSCFGVVSFPRQLLVTSFFLALDIAHQLADQANQRLASPNLESYTPHSLASLSIPLDIARLVTADYAPVSATPGLAFLKGYLFRATPLAIYIITTSIGKTPAKGFPQEQLSSSSSLGWLQSTTAYSQFAQQRHAHADGTYSASSAPVFAPNETVPVTTRVVQTGVVQIPATLSDKTPETTGVVDSGLDLKDKVTSIPIIQVPITSPISLIRTASNATATAVIVDKPITTVTMPSGDIFADPIATAAPPSQFQIRNDHPVEKKGVNSTTPLQTNKFFGNFLVGSQSAPAFTHPYSVAWAAGKGAAGSWGMAISHIEASQRVFGKARPGDGGEASYFINPIGIQSLIVSSKDLGKDTIIATDSITAFSARVHLRPNATAMPDVSFPLVQGMAFVTAQFAGAVPVIQSGVFFRNVTKVTADPKPGVAKFNFHLEDGRTWRVYAYATKGDPLELQVINNGYAEAKNPFYGIIQVAKDPGNAEALYDEAAGVFPTTVVLSGSTRNKAGSYTFKFAKDGHQQGTLVMYALPHHVESFDDTTRAAVREVKLQTTTKGIATAVMADQWTMVEPNLPLDMTFAPWDPERGTMTKMSDEARALIRGIAVQEASQNMAAQSDLDSMYFSGKALAKFAIMLTVINDLLEDKKLAEPALGKLKQAFARFAANKQKFPLVYERSWGGLVSSASYVTGNSGADFGNTYYNDHHFHYAYHVLAAAAIGHLDPSWIPENMAYVNLLVRDFANPSVHDMYFPQSRSFDWFHGHSWAQGLFESWDGKDQESSSEDVMQAYAIKMWGTVSGDAKMAARGNLMLSVQARSLQHYYLYTKDNKVEPAQFIGNKVAGILFENKIDHTTYFGANIEFIEGIHMIPLLPSSPLIRTRQFVQEEWDVYFSNGRAQDIQGGWKGIIFGNLATLNPKAAWDFFNSTDFDPSWIDGGASLTWYLAYSAVLGGL